MSDERRDHLVRFYSILDGLEQKLGGARTLAASTGQTDWPAEGIYFFRESGEVRTDSGHGPRIVHIGTHGVYSGARRRLWDRLREHRGHSDNGGGIHRISLFRNMVGAALMNRDGLDFPTWGKGRTIRNNKGVKLAEHPLEYDVSKIIGAMPVLWLAVEGGAEHRRYFVRNSIGLLSNYNRPPLDPPSPGWLGLHCNQETVRRSGLWNSGHVDENYDPAFLDRFFWLVATASPKA